MNRPAEKRKGSLLTEEQYAVFLRPRPEEERWQLIDGVAVMLPPLELRCSLRDLHRGTPLG